MRRWLLAFCATLIACVPILRLHATSVGLLSDTDTSVLLQAIRIRHQPLSWFMGDWPLQNHFYRPVATLSFELDNYLYGSHAAGYGWTNDLLCVACVLLLFWCVRELSDHPLFSAASAILFSLWHWGGATTLCEFAYDLAWLVLLLGAARHRRQWLAYVPVFVASFYFESELAGKTDLQSRMIDWLPGRTASVMSVFALIAFASYARYERLREQHKPQVALEPTPLTPPATRNTVLETRTNVRSEIRWPWVILCLMAIALSMASYEQGVMVPAGLLCIAIYFYLKGTLPNWRLQGAFWGLLGAYVLLRTRLVPSSASHYQLQQFRHGPGVVQSLVDYLMPAANGLHTLWSSFDDPLTLFTSPALYEILFFLISNLAALWLLFRRRPLLLANAARRGKNLSALAMLGIASSFAIYLPMAFLKQFDHYDYLPMAMRSVFVVALGSCVWRGWIIALRPQAEQAPQRSAPAPGSLPRQ